ncbi:Pr6Pr family membrane protein [Citricoccus sp. GCM10030269]|uniref:Pr6Pr family membrane protein n=1 Tax=Citricoccus sp. GCM10030269 TaxID=3273388 RepID=UPI003610E1C3
MAVASGSGTEPEVPTVPRWWAGVGRVVFALAALLSFTGNGLSFYIGSWKDSGLPENAGYAGVFEGGWEHLVNQPSYFTFLSNFLVGLTSLLLAIRVHRTSDVFQALRIAAVVCIVVTGVVFNVLLRDADPLTRVEQVNDTIQHVLAPLLTPLVWLVFDPHGQVTWKRIGLASSVPLAWLVFTLARGPFLDWYPYTILDVPRMGYGGVAVYMVSILAFFFAVSAVLWAVDQLLVRLARRSSAMARAR